MYIHPFLLVQNKLKSRKMKDERGRNDKEGKMKEVWRMKRCFADKQTDGQTDICYSRVAFATKMNYNCGVTPTAYLLVQKNYLYLWACSNTFSIGNLYLWWCSNSISIVINNWSELEEMIQHHLYWYKKLILDSPWQSMIVLDSPW